MFRTFPDATATLYEICNLTYTRTSLEPTKFAPDFKTPFLSFGGDNFLN